MPLKDFEEALASNSNRILEFVRFLIAVILKCCESVMNLCSVNVREVVGFASLNVFRFVS